MEGGKGRVIAASLHSIDLSGSSILSASTFFLHSDCGIVPLMDDALRKNLRPGVRVKVTQQIAGRDYTWTSDVTGTIVDYAQKQTGSWFAHSKDDKLWLDRLRLRKEDGELTTLNLDDYSRVEILSEPAAVVPAGGKTNESDLPV